MNFIIVVGVIIVIVGVVLVVMGKKKDGDAGPSTTIRC